MKIKRLIIILFLIPGSIGLSQILGYPDALYTKAERTQYLETSLHQDVINFVQMLDAGSDLVHSEIMGTSKGGRDMPLVVMADPGINTPEEAFNSGKIIIYIQANIHGGEVEGKEASMQLMREMALGQKRYLLKDQILLFCPIYNADGNDKLSRNSRPSQDGSPVEAGDRYSGEGYDLNRDGLKLETIEGIAMAENVILRWKPVMFVDLHTTNGTWHGYPLTYAPGIKTAGHPGTYNYLMEELLPEVTEKVRERSGIDTYFYGNFSEFPPKTYNGMIPLPRYITNSLALRNMLTILIETFAHDRFERRILSNTSWLTSMLEYTSEHASEISNLISTIETEVVEDISNFGGQTTRGVRFERSQLGPSSDLLVYSTESNIDQFGINRNKRTGRRYWVSGVKKMLTATATELATVPLAYVFPSELTSVADKLRQHGIPVQQLSSNSSFGGEEFTVSSFSQERSNYQGHHLTTISGSFAPLQKDFTAGDYYVDMHHPLAYLAFYLLEPRADDGLIVWNYFDEYLINQGVQTQNVPFPVFKVLQGGLSADVIVLDQLIHIIPDHFAGAIEIKLSNGLDQVVEIQITDMQGRVVGQGAIPVGDTRIKLHTNDKNAGLYLIRIRTGNQQVIRKVAFL